MFPRSNYYLSTGHALGSTNFIDPGHFKIISYISASDQAAGRRPKNGFENALKCFLHRNKKLVVILC